jgi:uncharacterized membrane protein
METDKTLVIVNLAIPLVIIALSIPLVYSKVPPNGWYGFRTPKTLSSDAMWYRTNKIGGRYFIVAAVFQLAAVLVVVTLWPGLATRLLGYGILPTVPLLIAVLLWFLRIRKF